MSQNILTLQRLLEDSRPNEFLTADHKLLISKYVRGDQTVPGVLAH